MPVESSADPQAGRECSSEALVTGAKGARPAGRGHFTLAAWQAGGGRRAAGDTWQLPAQCSHTAANQPPPSLACPSRASAGAALFGGISAAVQYGAFAYRPELARLINPTVRTALIIMPALFAFGYRAQHAMNACAQRHHHHVAQQAG